MKVKRRRLSVQALVGVLVAAMTAGAAAWWNQNWLKEETYALSNATLLNTAHERALNPGEPFKECGDCPEMVAVPAGRFSMGSPEDPGGVEERPPGSVEELPAHDVTIARSFAVSKFALTFAEWDACAEHGDCTQGVSDSGWGRGRRPAINVSWDDAQTYVKWLSRIAGRQYRLLSEAEYEYATRAGTETKYPWGDEIKLNGWAMANCNNCGSEWDGRQTAPVGSFPANAFGLYDMVGNVREWTEDCWNDNYKGAPADGSPRTSGDCGGPVVRSGSWGDSPVDLRSAYRNAVLAVTRVEGDLDSVLVRIREALRLPFE